MSDGLEVVRGCPVCRGPVLVEARGRRCPMCEPHPDPKVREREQAQLRRERATRKDPRRYERL